MRAANDALRFVAHRGFWRTAGEKNTREAFERALREGHGIETDVRDAYGKLVISHDMPKGTEMSVEEFLALCTRHPASRPLALNVKADGLHAALREAVELAGLDGYFVFDMSVPDTLGYLRQGTPTFTRMSEYEPRPAFLERAQGVWLDAFESDWFDAGTIARLVEKGKQVCVVSPELHGRDHAGVWQLMREAGFGRSPLVSLCTDLPDRAREFFVV